MPQNGCLISNSKGIGIDAISIDAVDTVDFDNHYVFLNQNFIIIENLTNLVKFQKSNLHLVLYHLRPLMLMVLQQEL